jgi:hypothetical protein
MKNPKDPNSHFKTDDYKHIMSWHDEDMLKQAAFNTLYHKALRSRLTKENLPSHETLKQVFNISQIAKNPRVAESAKRTVEVAKKTKLIEKTAVSATKAGNAFLKRVDDIIAKKPKTKSLADTKKQTENIQGMFDQRYEDASGKDNMPRFLKAIDDKYRFTSMVDRPRIDKVTGSGRYKDL